MKKLSNSELEFMQYLWSCGEEKNIRDFASHFADKGWERSTISVFLHKLTQNGYLLCRQEGRHYFYTPAISQVEYEQELINRKMVVAFGKPLENVIAAFCGKAKDSRQIERIKDFLKELEEEQDEDTTESD